MKTLKILTMSIVAGLIISASVSAGTINTIEQIEETALLNNLEYKTAVLEVMKAENALESNIKLEDASLSLSSSYSQDSTSDLEDLDWDASLSLPLFEQLTVSSSVDQDLTGTFSLNLSPLAHSDSTKQTALYYQTKLAAAEEMASEIAATAVKNYLDWAAAEADYNVKQKAADVKKLLYEDEKVRYEKDESTLDDVRDAFTAWSESRTSMNSALSEFQTAETELYKTLNIDSEENIISGPAESELTRLINSLENSLENSSLSITGSYNILSAQSEAESLQIELNDTRLFDPDLQFSGTLSTEQGEVPSVSATASITIGLDDWNAKLRKELETELEISRQQATQTINTEHLNLKQAQTTAETAAINYELADVELMQAEELLEEAKFLHQIGEYSEAELEETELLYELTRNGLFEAAAERYTALRSLLEYTN